MIAVVAMNGESRAGVAPQRRRPMRLSDLADEVELPVRGEAKIAESVEWICVFSDEEAVMDPGGPRHDRRGIHRARMLGSVTDGDSAGSAYYTPTHCQTYMVGESPRWVN